MPTRDQQRNSAEAGAVAAAAVDFSADNPLERETSRAPPPTPRALREVGGAESITNAVFLGADALALVENKTVTLHSLTDTAEPLVLLVDNSASSDSIRSCIASGLARRPCALHR